MDEQVSWKGHSFTLLVFGGIVFLCSIFFVLGMLVGHGQGKSTAEAASVSAAVKTATVADVRTPDIRIQDDKSSISQYQGIQTGKELNKEANNKETIKEKKVDAELDPLPRKDSTPAAAPKVAPKAAAAKPSAPPSAKPATPAKPAAPVLTKMIYLQVAAWEKDSAANKQLDELRKKGFPAVITKGEGANALYRVQVGPFSNATDAETAKSKLESLGFKPIKK